MAGPVFFISWALWQQMTFVLAMAIVVVFCAGLVKLWWSNRLLRRQEILDEEKRARLQEMRKSGIPLKRTNDIPFGVRAIQSGVEVDGIWISRPLSLNETATPKTGYSTTLQPQAPVPPISQFATQPKRRPNREASVLSEDTLKKLEHQAHPKPAYETYIPTSAPRNPRQPSQRSSASSSGESTESQPRSARSASGRSYTSSRSSRLYMAKNLRENRLAYNGVPQGWQEKDLRDPFDTPARTPSGFSALSQSDTLSSMLQSREPPSVPEPTFGPGDLHLNKSTRKVNDGFEVLPAGTFGIPPEFSGSVGATDLEGGHESGRSDWAARPSNRL
ncbi:hypothetical protein B0T24DRAFT_519212 [Lasiosphaeria ovina]|uniref:Uncharacterized protein n=1 Tax=Lasiosphaeria ovina TaxID=92902 RepID=A0AAE0NM16_9PEZI|nr:hypothetical protein B0T24DRAFT_519212 [Lasiosphaeria ovina]